MHCKYWVCKDSMYLLKRCLYRYLMFLGATPLERTSQSYTSKPLNQISLATTLLYTLQIFRQHTWIIFYPPQLLTGSLHLQTRPSSSLIKKFIKQK